MSDTQLDQSTLAFPRDGYRVRFSPCGFFVLSNMKADNREFCQPSVKRILFTHTHTHTQSNLEIILELERIVLISFAYHLIAAAKFKLRMKLTRGPSKLSVVKLKNDFAQTQYN